MIKSIRNRMSKKIILEKYEEQLRAGLSKYTRKAFQILPKLNKPHILDVGCGSGVPTIELAKLSNGQITGLDTNQSSLEKLGKKIRKLKLSNRVKIIKCSILKMDFPDESFNIIWSEGAIYAIGFEKGLKKWRSLLKTNGFLIVHDESKNTGDKLRIIPKCGYKLLGHFSLSENVWWLKYYNPLEKKIQELRKKYMADAELLKVLDKKQRDIDTFKKNQKSYSSVFFIMQKI